MTGRVYPPTAERLAAKTQKNQNGCWLWTGAVQACGYGTIRHKGSNEFVHRVAYQLANNVKLQSPRINGLVVCHTCDVRNCVNPAHLFLGTYSDNTRDMIQKGRRVAGDQRGSKNHQSKLNETQALAILNDKRSLTEVARDHGVSVPLVCMIRKGQRWGHLSKTENEK